MIRKISIIDRPRQPFSRIEAININFYGYQRLDLSDMIFKIQKASTSRHAEFQNTHALMIQFLGKSSRVIDNVAVVGTFHRANLQTEFIAAEMRFSDQSDEGGPNQ